MEFEWKPGYKLSTRVDDDATVIAGNAEGLASLADHLLRLAADHAPSGAHLHLDDLNGLEPGSVEIILERSEGAASGYLSGDIPEHWRKRVELARRSATRFAP